LKTTRGTVERDDDIVDLARQAAVPPSGGEPDEILVRRALMLGRSPPGAKELRSPSQTEKTVLVLPQSMHRSIGSSLRRTHPRPGSIRIALPSVAQHKRTVFDPRLSNTAGTCLGRGPRSDDIAQPRRPVQPGRADRAKPIGDQLRLPAGEGRGQMIQDRVSGVISPRFRPGTDTVLSPPVPLALDRRSASQVDADADGKPWLTMTPCPALSSRMPATLPPFSSTSFGHFSARRRARPARSRSA
jgi:hypothetical protein